MTIIYKYPLSLNGLDQTIEMPSGSRILVVGGQHGEPVLLAQVDTDAKPCKRVFVVVGTGHHVPPNDSGLPGYVGTAFCDPFVWHVYEVTL